MSHFSEHSPSRSAPWASSPELLTGANFGTVVLLDDYDANGTWATYRFGVDPFAGQTVKLRIKRTSGTSGPIFHVDDAGKAESVLPGWKMPRTETVGTDAVTTGSDANGSYATSPEAGGSLFLRSPWLSSGMVDVASTQYRYYSIAYDIGYSQANILRVYWVNDQGGSWQVFTDAADSPTGYRVAWFSTYDFVGARGYLEVQLANGGKVYSIADNTDIARHDLGASLDDVARAWSVVARTPYTPDRPRRVGILRGEPWDTLTTAGHPMP